MGDWTFFSNHAHVLFLVSAREKITVRQLSLEIGITERFVIKIIQDLQDKGFIIVDKSGRNNRYRFNREKKLRHPVESHVKVGHLIDLIQASIDPS